MMDDHARDRSTSTLNDLLAGNISVAVTLYAVSIGFICNPFDQQR